MDSISCHLVLEDVGSAKKLVSDSLLDGDDPPQRGLAMESGFQRELDCHQALERRSEPQRTALGGTSCASVTLLLLSTFNSRQIRTASGAVDINWSPRRDVCRLYLSIACKERVVREACQNGRDDA